MRVAVLQSNYLPWRGYFDIIRRAEVFIFYDDVKFTKNDWRNRNLIKTPNGPIWLTIPCPKNYDVMINEVRPTNSLWQSKHWKTICQNYAKAPHFEQYASFFEDFYLHHSWGSLSHLNQHVIKHVATNMFGLRTKFEDTSKRHLLGTKNARLLNLLDQIGASVYVSGPSARGYIDEDAFRRKGIAIEWMDYSRYPQYPQLYPPFETRLSILDLIFNAGADPSLIMPSK